MIEISVHDLAIVEEILRSTLGSGTKVFVFGSRVKENAKPIKKSSDLDLAIDTKRKLTRQEEQKLFDQFEESDLPYHVDFVDLNVVEQNFKNLITSTSQLLLEL